VLTDQPALDAKHLCELRDRWMERPGHAVASGYAGTIGVPAMIPRTWFAAIESQQGDRGARELLRARTDEVIVVSGEQLAQDIDEPEHLSRLNHI
jgi:CTP:molybdopterin cytidylyltransferase MocA